MYKIKLLILLLISVLALSCSNKNIKHKSNSFSLSSIGGEYDGLILSNLLRSYLAGYSSFDPDTNLKIQGSISHSSSIYITNIDNTSDREKIETSVSLKVYNEIEKCYVYELNEHVTQFYIFSLNEKFISNQKAFERIKYENTEELVKQFINEVLYKDLKCFEQYSKINKLS